ncbi:iron-sulfur cluster assembly scaffold protein [Candidatus Woesearchaeota archaeon CG10_big_fil_rev_8_21_14_0_10_36_11]|nr:MAG: iron-sulfur cluster assembly scaffold protein [Candidatus Woesearchaeota archaeon CG10_big_fil_rev_8_21_14_0_10_36_11]
MTITHKTEVKGKNGENWLYSENVKKHFFHPQNTFKSQEEEEEFEKNADGIGEVGSPACGDMMRMYIKVKNGKIVACRWKTFGCASAIASTSILSEMVIGKTIDDARKITPQDIVQKLNGLPLRKIHCSVLGDKALQKAIDAYEKKKK